MVFVNKLYLSIYKSIYGAKASNVIDNISKNFMGEAVRRQILGVVATPFTMLTTHQNAPEAYPSLTSYAADH